MICPADGSLCHDLDCSLGGCSGAVSATARVDAALRMMEAVAEIEAREADAEEIAA